MMWERFNFSNKNSAEFQLQVKCSNTYKQSYLLHASIFLTAVWLHHRQICAVIDGAAYLTRC